MSSDILKNKTVLLVDDEMYSRHVFGTALYGLGGPRLVVADNGAEALEYLGDSDINIDLIVSDFNMPVVHGLQLLKAVRTGVKPVDRAMPFAMLTGYSDERLVDMALALDVNAFLIKPASKEALSKRLAKLMSSPTSEQWLKQVISYDAIDVDEALNEIAKPDVEPKQTRRIQLMPENKALFRNPNAANKAVGVPVRGLADKPGKKSGKKGVPVRGLPDKPGKESSAKEVPDRRQPDNSGKDYPLPERRQLPGRLCPIGEIPEHAVLARDVYTAHGALFMHAGTELSPRIVSILSDLHDLDHPVKDIWIATDEPSP